MLTDQWKTVDQCQLEAVNSVLVRNVDTQDAGFSASFQYQIPSVPCCPIDHCNDPPLVQSYYKMIRRYELPLPGGLAVHTVHR